MPVSAYSTTLSGPVTSQNAIGIASRTLGGVFDAPVSYTDFGLPAFITDPTNTFVSGSTVSLSTVNLPAYALAQGTVLRLSFSGYVTWNSLLGAGEPIQMGLRISPVAAALSQTFDLGPAVTSSGIGLKQVFSGQLFLLARTEPSADADVSIHMSYASIANSGVASPVVIIPLTPAVKSNGVIGLTTGGFPAGTDIEVTATMSAGLLGNSVRVIQLIECVTELIG